MKRMILSMIFCCGMSLPVAAIPDSEKQFILNRFNNTFVVISSHFHTLGSETIPDRQHLANQVRGFIRKLEAHRDVSPEVSLMICKCKSMLARIERHTSQE